VDELGSDPLNILDFVRTSDTEQVPTEREPSQDEWVREKLEEIEAPQWWSGDSVEGEPIVVVDPTTTVVESKPEPEQADTPVTHRESERARRARERTEKKINQNVSWLYSALMNGPVAGYELKKRAAKAGISEYALLQARRAVNDIEITTVGYQGTRYWHLTTHAHMLPQATTFRPSEVKNADISPNEQKILDLLQEKDLTTAELIGRTGWTPQKVKINTQKLSVRKLIKNNRRTLKWSRYDD
jgi:hypothetical protein